MRRVENVIDIGEGEREGEVDEDEWYESRRKRALSSHVICLMRSHRQIRHT